MSMVRNVRTPEGIQLGANHVRLLGKKFREDDDRCRSCAFRLGTLPNGSPTTQMDILKCVMEGVPFHCHSHDGGYGADKLCHGYVMAREGIGGERPGLCPWSFSDEITPEGTAKSPA